jgi:hypothetical protein
MSAGNPGFMNTQKLEVNAVTARGYTDAEAQTIYLVESHSGYFVARQFPLAPGNFLDRCPITLHIRIRSHLLGVSLEQSSRKTSTRKPASSRSLAADARTLDGPRHSLPSCLVPCRPLQPRPPLFRSLTVRRFGSPCRCEGTKAPHRRTENEIRTDQTDH